MKSIKITLLVFIIVSAPVFTFAKDYNPLSLRYCDQGGLFLGGNFGIQFGSETLIDISPMGGYYIFDNTAVGIGATYQYYNIRNISSSFDTHILGGRLFARYYLDFLFAHIEYELINFETALIDQYGLWHADDRVTVPSFMVGLGLRSMISESSFATLTVLYNLNETPETLYINPVIRVGMVFDLHRD